jgi:hypothetical protein
MGWKLDASAMAEIDRIVEESVTDPVGPEYLNAQGAVELSACRSAGTERVSSLLPIFVHSIVRFISSVSRPRPALRY